MIKLLLFRLLLGLKNINLNKKLISYLYFDDGLTVVDVEPVDALVSNHFENGHDLPDFRKVAEELEAAAVYS